jgi:hypothetical protein
MVGVGDWLGRSHRARLHTGIAGQFLTRTLMQGFRIFPFMPRFSGPHFMNVIASLVHSFRLDGRLLPRVQRQSAKLRRGATDAAHEIVAMLRRCEVGSLPLFPCRSYGL